MTIFNQVFNKNLMALTDQVTLGLSISPHLCEITSTTYWSCPNPSIPQAYICVAQWPVCLCGGASTPDYHEYVEGLTWVQPLWLQETISLICLKAAVQQNKSAFWSSGLQCTHTFRAVHTFRQRFLHFCVCSCCTLTPAPFALHCKSHLCNWQ